MKELNLYNIPYFTSFEVQKILVAAFTQANYTGKVMCLPVQVG